MFRQLQRRCAQLDQNIKVTLNTMLESIVPAAKSMDIEQDQMVALIMSNVQQYKLQLAHEMFISMGPIPRPTGAQAAPLFPRNAPIAADRASRPTDELRIHFERVRHKRTADDDDDNNNRRPAQRPRIHGRGVKYATPRSASPDNRSKIAARPPRDKTREPKGAAKNSQ